MRVLSVQQKTLIGVQVRRANDRMFSVEERKVYQCACEQYEGLLSDEEER